MRIINLRFLGQVRQYNSLLAIVDQIAWSSITFIANILFIRQSNLTLIGYLAFVFEVIVLANLAPSRPSVRERLALPILGNTEASHT